MRFLPRTVSGDAARILEKPAWERGFSTSQGPGRSKAVPVALACLLLASVLSGCVNDGSDSVGPPWENTRISGNITVDARRVDDTYRWDVSYEITNATWVDERPRWQDATVDMDFYADIEPRQTFDLLPGAPDDPNEPHCRYVDTSGDPMGPDAGDVIMLGGLNRTHQRAEVDVLAENFRLSFDLPDEWNETFVLNLSSIEWENPDLDAYTWDAVVPIGTTEPGWERFPRGWLAISGGTGLEPILPYPETGETSREGRGYYFREPNNRDGLVGPGDELVITNVTRKWRESVFHIETGGEVVGVVKFPDRIPYVGGTCQLSEPVIIPYYQGTEVFDEVTWAVVDVTALADPIPWKGTLLELDALFGGGEFDALSTKNRHTHRVQGWVVDADGDRSISVGDVVHFSGLDHRVVGRNIAVERAGMAVATTRLPLLLHGGDEAFKLVQGSLETYETVNGTRFQVEYSLDRLHPVGVKVPWALVNATVYDAVEDRVLVGRFPLVRDEASRAPITTVLVEVPPGDGLASAGDVVIFRGFNYTLLGAVVRLDMHGMGLDAFPLPRSVVPLYYSAFKLHLGQPRSSMVEVDGQQRWRVTMEAYNTTDGGEVPWEGLTLDMVAWNGTTLTTGMPLDPFPSGTQEWEGFNTLDLSAWHIGSSLEVNSEGRIGLTGLTEMHGGARLVIRMGGVLAYEVILPGTLPS